ncbi:sensor histidine kinase [Croceicoccus naphthovorans]|uniref:histidine kinase n=1 Tax=Croceicoccus naphthovorans TaxID=1348774 RepID=A0A0G3XJY1_9SPHN|nr:HAMP domain-containing sensor histidine kinase [Croceicoccus naphthovorans]AKM10673.1 histidine kinase [Croceicoccus naphthovorans]MBB3988909.1 signal transduction histidine kinase [Croceicoccus naphthovorans]
MGADALRAKGSIFSRIVWVSIGASILLIAGLWLVTDLTIRSTLEDSARKAVDVDLAGLVDIHASGDTDELVRRIGDRLSLRPSEGGTPHYLLLGDGDRLAGDIPAWPALDAAVSESGTIRIGEGTRAYARATQLGPDLRLLVARETDEAEALRARVRVVFIVGGAAFVALVAFFGQLSAGRLQRRIAQVNLALRDTAENRGGLPTTERHGDEIDDLAHDSAAVIGRVQNLLTAHRDTTDRLAHEIRTPLMHLDARLAKALDAGPSDDVSRRLVEAREEIRRLVGVLESLLDIAWSKAREGDHAGLKPVDLSQVVSRMCELYTDSAEDLGLHFGTAISPGVVLDGEEPHLARLLTNLLDNALKYVPEGGTIRVTLTPGPVLIVEDDGPGVPEADQEAIFERFHRARGASQGGERPGAGLGLALARAIAERHGLTLEYRAKDKGACFVVERKRA